MEVKNGEFHLSSFSVVKYCTFGYKWEIKNYNSVRQSHETIQSSEFGPTADESRKWFIKFFSKEISEDNTGRWNIHLCRTDDEDVYINANMFILTPSNERIKFGETFTAILPSKFNAFFTEEGSVIANNLNWKNDSEDTLVIICVIQTFFELLNVPTSKIDARNLIEDISLSMDDPSFKDFTFSVQGKEFSVHKSILAARSEVFAAMFKNSTSEQLQSRVEVEDIDPEIFEKMLNFIYSDEVYDLQNAASRLFVAAHKYDLKKLQQMCSESLCENLSTNNVFESLLLAEFYSASELMENALQFLVAHFQELKNTEDFEFLIKSRPQLATKIFKLLEKVESTDDRNEIES